MEFVAWKRVPGLGSEVCNLATGAEKEADIFAMAEIVATIVRAEEASNEVAMDWVRILAMATTVAVVAVEL